MVVLAAVAIGRDVLAARRAGADPSDTGHGHHRPSRSPWLLLLPVMAIFLISPPALGADTVNRAAPRAPAEPAKSTAFPPLPAGAVVPKTLTDFVTRSAWDGTNALNNRAVRLTGFVARDPAGRVYVARLVITCCAADAWPVKARLTGVDVSPLHDDEWVDAVGSLVPGSATQANQYVPTLTATDLRPVPAPADPYEY
jgi:uncharacterized repeat protein (TIGR03943 family)